MSSSSSIDDELQLHEIKLQKMIEDINDIPHDIPNKEFDESNLLSKSQPYPTNSKTSSKISQDNQCLPGTHTWEFLIVNCQEINSEEN